MTILDGLHFGFGFALGVSMFIIGGFLAATIGLLLFVLVNKLRP